MILMSNLFSNNNPDVCSDAFISSSKSSRVSTLCLTESLSSLSLAILPFASFNSPLFIATSSSNSFVLFFSVLYSSTRPFDSLFEFLELNEFHDAVLPLLRASRT